MAIARFYLSTPNNREKERQQRRGKENEADESYKENTQRHSEIPLIQREKEEKEAVNLIKEIKPNL